MSQEQTVLASEIIDAIKNGKKLFAINTQNKLASVKKFPLHIRILFLIVCILWCIGIRYQFVPAFQTGNFSGLWEKSGRSDFNTIQDNRSGNILDLMNMVSDV